MCGLILFGIALIVGGLWLVNTALASTVAVLLALGVFAGVVIAILGLACVIAPFLMALGD